MAWHDRYCGDWCEGLTLVRDRGEKEAAFKGLCLVMRHNPAGVLNVSSRRVTAVSYNIYLS